MQMWTNHHTRKWHCPNGSGQGVYDINERCGWGFWKQLDDDACADENADDDNYYPGDAFFATEGGLEDVPGNGGNL